MTKANKVPKVEPRNQKTACLMCKKEYKSVIELCTYCKKKLKAANASNSSGIESGLLNAFLEQRARERQSAVNRLAIETKPASDTSKATIVALRKKVKALNERLRKMPARLAAKAANGFKQKAP